jgi:hypothetical protein
MIPRNEYKKWLTTGLLLIGLAILSTGNVLADTITPAIVDIKVESSNLSNNFKNSQFEIAYTNETNSTQSYSISISNYSPESRIQNSAINTSSSSIFVSSEKSQFTLTSQEKILLKFAIKLDEALPSGSYFNIVNIIPQNSSDKKSLSINYGLGSIIAVHKMESNEEYINSLKSKVYTKLSVLNIGDFLSPTTLKWEITNNSNYVFHVSLNSSYINSNGKEKSVNIEMPKEYDSFTLYQGDTITKEVKVNLWNVKSILDTFHMTTQATISSETFTDTIDLTIITRALKINALIISVGIVLFFSGAAIISKFVKGRFASQKKL